MENQKLVSHVWGTGRICLFRLWSRTQSMTRNKIAYIPDHINKAVVEAIQI